MEAASVAIAVLAHRAGRLKSPASQVDNNIVDVLPSSFIAPCNYLRSAVAYDRFSHFCTAHGRVSSGMIGHVLSPNNCPFAWVIWVPSNTRFFGPTRVRNLNGILISSAVLHTAESRYTLQRALPFPKLPFP